MEELPLYDTPSRVGIIIDLTCGENIRFFKEAAAEDKLGLRWSWLIDAGNSTDVLSGIHLGFINDVTVVTHDDSNPGYFPLYHAFTQQYPRKMLIKTAVGNWTTIDGLKYHPSRREYSLERATLKAAIFMTQDIYHDDQIYTELQNRTYMPSLDSSNRFHFAVAQHIADLLNYSIELVKSNDWGERLPNGSYSGMVGMLITGAADITVGPMRLAAERMDVAAPLFPTQRFVFPFVFKQPKKTGTYKALALQLQTEVWVYTALMAIIICVTLTAIHWLRNTVKRRRGLEYYQEEEECLPFNAILVIGTLSQQGLMFEPPDIARRIACFFLLFCFLMVAVFYNAATMNALLSPSPNSIRNLKELLASDVPLAMNDAPYFTHAPVRKVILDQEVIDRVNHYSLGFLSLEQGLQLILKGGAFCGEDFTLFKGIHANFVDEQKCDLSVIQSSRAFPASFWIPKNSLYKEVLLQGTLRVKEHGLVDRQYRYWFPAKPECLVNQRWLWVGLEAVSIALSIFVVGFFISSAIFIVELVSTLSFFHRKARKSF
ncbi:hypothetical protein GE061_012435 [Apolygus lucorum]|uniref:Ionotropic glutamate receptor C-terminal domain-containing protein n=1 Tax=Apolygus lucorum TaxID=248454 RepID=A0A8S9XUK4_APOLU|nr:hypothetical protein GE061_012435 [Apolygus lucorum]